MNEDNFKQWIHLISTRPNTSSIFLQRIFDSEVDKCSCIQDEKIFINGNINNCIKCTDKICTLDTHKFLGTASTAIIGWLSLLLEGFY